MIEDGDRGGSDPPEPPEAPRATGRRRLPGVDLKLGKVKQARLEARLSLAQLGKGRVTAPAIYLIETGRTRPSLPTLEHIARRTGKPVEFFLADPGGATDVSQAALIELETLVAAGRNAEAVAAGQKLLSLGSSAHRLGRIRFFLAQAHLNLGELKEAAALLQDAHAHFEAVDDRLMLAECLGFEAWLAHLTRKPGAVALVERALAICRGFTPVLEPTEARLLVILAGLRLANREWDAAVASYRQALTAESTLADLGLLAEMYRGLSDAYRANGQLDASARFAGKATTLLDVLHDRLWLARAQDNLGQIMLARGDQAAAREHLDRSPGSFQDAELQVGRSGELLSLCELSLKEGHTGQALELAQQALELAERWRDPATAAEAHVSLAQVADRVGDAPEADRHFQMAINDLTRLGLEEALLRCHGAYAEVLERRGEMELAYVHMKKAFAASRPGLLGGHDEEPEESASLA